MKKDYLTGKCLVAMPNLEDERFKNTVVYLCAHNQEGAMGFIVNKQIKEFCFSDLVGQFNIAIEEETENLSSTETVPSFS